ncbi:leukocyte elastase inhibitor-like [Phyllobates terribilis]|uniref:leukocyte elastase inhibitor-like n=1 Tax=Phyllobates terribilis TaxID=111132 RepID=UPI003CCB3750
MDISDANNQFAFNALKAIGASDVGQNVVIAPLSIITALSMVFLGARGSTAAQMSKTLHFSDKKVRSSSSNLLRELVENKDDYVLLNVNKLFGEKTFQFLPTFLDDTKNVCDAGLEQLDFLSNPETSRKYINDWITQQTQGKIQQLLPDQSISTTTKLVIANTLYFAANWTKPFSEMKTSKAPFTRLSNEKVMVNMMHITNYFKVKYIKNPGIKLLELPYGVDQDYTMMIFLPDNNSVFKQVKEMSAEEVNKLMDNSEMKMMNVLVHLPKFRIEKSFSMKSMLSSLGISDAFSQTKADFSGMTKQGDMFVSEVYHQTVLELNEKGTEAASSTASVMSVRSFPGEEVKCDHPFYFFIKHKKSNYIILCGILNDP